MPPKAALDQETAITRCVADIVAELIACKRKGGPMPAVDGLKFRMARKHGVNGVPKLSDIVAAVPDVDRKALLPCVTVVSAHFLNLDAGILTTKPVRTASGIAVVALMSKPHRCVIF